jgi:hypothetical protein
MKQVLFPHCTHRQKQLILSIPLTINTQAYTEQSSRLFEWDRGKGRGREGAGGDRTGQDEMRQTEGRQKTSVPI